jgi:Protein of unknown function (DUF1566)
MNRLFLMWAVGAVALLPALPRAGTALSVKSPQQLCDYARVKAWRTYLSAMESHLALDARGSWTADHFLAFARTRHGYLSQWDRFQTKGSLVGSSCVGSRFTDNGTAVTDNLTGLQWEKKTADGSVQDRGDLYPWSTSGTAADGGAFRSLLVGLNAPTCLAGQCDWRLPTMEELQSILLDFPCLGDGVGTSCRCPASPCIDGVFGPTQSNYYWSATSSIPNPSAAWTVDFNTATVVPSNKSLTFYARAVRGGL